MTLKEIVTLPAEAKFVHAIAGTLYYRITTDDVVVEFPIDMNDKDDVAQLPSWLLINLLH